MPGSGTRSDPPGSASTAACSVTVHVPGRRPVVEAQPRGAGVVVRLVRRSDHRARRSRSPGRTRGTSRATAASASRRPPRDPCGSTDTSAGSTSLDAGVEQQLLDRHLGHGVLALAEVVVPDPSLGIGEVDRRPEVVGERPPDPVVAVDRDRVLDPEGARLRDRRCRRSCSNPNSGVWTPIDGQPLVARTWRPRRARTAASAAS